MKTLTFIFLLISEVLMANSLNSSYELIYIYGTFICIVLLIIGIDRVIKYVRKKLKKSAEIFTDHEPSNSFIE